MSKKQIVKLVLSLVGVASILLAVALGISYNFLPHALRLLPLPLLLVGIAVLLVLKTTGTTLDAKKETEGEGDASVETEEPASQETVEGTVGSGTQSGQANTSENCDESSSTQTAEPGAENAEVGASIAEQPARPAAQAPKKNVPVTVKRKPNKK